MGNPIVILALGVLFVIFAGYLVYTGSIGIWAGAALLGFIISVFGIMKCAGDGGSTKHKILACIFFVLSLGFMGVFIWKSEVFSSDKNKYKGPDLKLNIFEVARANVFANKLVDLAPGAKILLISGSNRENESVIKAQIEELKKVFGTKMEIGAIETFPVERIKGIVPRFGLTKETGAKEYEAVILKHKDCNLIISLVGLPREFWKMGIWRWNDLARPKLAFLEGEPRILMNFIKKGQVCLFAAYKPGWTYVPDAPADPELAFAMRYLLIGEKGVYQIPTPPVASTPGEAPAASAVPAEPPKSP